MADKTFSTIDSNKDAQQRTQGVTGHFTSQMMKKGAH